MSRIHKSLNDSTFLVGGISKFENKENLNTSEIKQMVELLKAYETLCIQREDFNGAESVKNKIQQLKQQQLICRKEGIAIRQKQQIESVCRQGEEEIKHFLQIWDKQIQNLLQELKIIEEEMCKEQKRQFEEYRVKIEKEEIPRVKYSSYVLERRKYLSSLIKSRNYKEAEEVKNSLKEHQIVEEKKWIEKHSDRIKLKLEKIEKKQISELQALRVKLQGCFNEKIKERDRKFEILLKKNRKRRIESSKASRERIRSRNGILTESKLNIGLNQSLHQ